MSGNVTRTLECSRSRTRSAEIGLRIGAILIAGAVLFTTGGCVAPGNRTVDVSSEALAPGAALDRIVAEDLASILEQVLEPRATTVQINRDRSDAFTTRLVDRLVDGGFGIQRVAADQGAHYLEHQRDIVLPGNGGAHITETVTVGQIEAQRDFSIQRNGSVRTASPFRVTGVRRPLEVDLVTKPPLQIADPSHQRVEYIDAVIHDTAYPLPRIVTPAVVERVALGRGNGMDTASLIGTRHAPRHEPGPQPSHEPSHETDHEPPLEATAQAVAETVEPNNLFYGTSAFESEFDGLERVERQVIVFANDSLNLGERNKRLVARLVRGSIRVADRISLIGCSTGHTALDIGNEGLALGRAERVIDELVDQGIPREKILDEGCWAPVSAGDDFPGRGVIIDIWRRPA